MEIFLLLLFLSFILYVILGRKNKAKPAPVGLNHTNISDSQASDNLSPDRAPKKEILSDEESRKEAIKSLIGSIKITVSTGNDTSVIDVTDQGYKLPSSANATGSVPHWPHQYVYGYDEVNSATPAQKAFYQRFKVNFLNGIYLNVEGNSNYYFILLFDLLNEADRQANLDDLERNLKALAEHYPRTASYCRNFLFRKMQERGDQTGVNRLVNEGAFQSFVADYNYYRLGSRLKDKLKLTNEEVLLANKISDPANSFSGIEFCLRQMVRLYLHTVVELNKIYATESTTLDEQMSAVADLVAKKIFHYKPGTYNYKYAVESTTNELYTLLFKHCENALREHFGHKRKLNTDCNYKAEIKQELEVRILSKLPTIFPVVLPAIELPDTAAEILLNEQNTTRWKLSFEKLTNSFSAKDSDQFVEKVIVLGKVNKKNPSVENIFFEASKFMAKWDKEASLKLYIHYLYHDMQSEFFDKKPFAKTIQKNLFKNNEEFQYFERIVTDLIENKNLEQAVNAIPGVYAPRRKKIKLDSAMISEVSKQHSNTVDLLEEILVEEEGIEKGTAQSILSDEISLQAAASVQVITATAIAGLTSVQTELLEFFFKSSFAVAQAEIDVFARTKGLFSSGLIESVNESCYEKLDDVLIEEEDDNYIMNQNYYHLITANNG